MKPVKMMILASCPHCRRALRMMDQLKADHPEYEKVQVEIIEEDLHPEIADRLDYYYVPTFYVGEEKVHEGVPSMEAVEEVFEKALEYEKEYR